MTPKEKALAWLNSPIESQDKEQIEKLLQPGNEKELEDAFYIDLDFGTGGLRGIMGVGTNRINKYTVGMTTQGLSNYLNKVYQDEDPKVVIAYDSRNNSEYFSQICADVFSANNIIVYRFNELRPTPELSFAIRFLNCHSGVVLTASHNPREYNGYKVYWDDGGQITHPHDQNIIDEVVQINNIESVNFVSKPELVHTIGPDVDEGYFSELQKLFSHSGEKNLKIVYSPIHGTGITMIPEALNRVGFKNIHVVEAQKKPDGNFPTVVYPNPEEKEAMKMALIEAKKHDADLVLATDPDADRVGIATKNLNGEYELLDGNQTGTLVMHHLMKQRYESVTGNEFIAKTIVTTELIDTIARQFNITCYNTLTGFKYIAELIRTKEGKEQFIAGCEESYGFMIGDFVRDKDAISACAIISELTYQARLQGRSLFELLVDIYVQFGFYRERLVSLTRKGKEGAEQIKHMMHDFRKNPPEKINGESVFLMTDHLIQQKIFLKDGVSEPTSLPSSDVLQFYTNNNTKVSLRPSGTEPKIKFYISVWDKLPNVDVFEQMKERLDLKISDIIANLGLSRD